VGGRGERGLPLLVALAGEPAVRGQALLQRHAHPQALGASAAPLQREVSGRVLGILLA